MAGRVAPCSAYSTEGLPAVGGMSAEIAEVCASVLAVRGNLARGGGIYGAQHAGTVRGFGGIKADKDCGSSRWLADRSSEAVVNVMAKATAKRS
jgi:hypothetical protein